jgi:dihydroorotate dehydrogenase (fumarate)
LSEWTSFAKEIENAGADGIELNLFILPSDTQLLSGQVEEIYLEIINDIIKKVNIPLGLKVSGNFSGMARTMLRFSFSGVNNLVFFNRFFSPDIDIENLKTAPAGLFSSPADIYHPLRWIALLSDRIYCDIVASSGIHDGEGLVKVLLAGAKAAQICSALYQQGFSVIGRMLKYLEEYMERKGFSSLDEMISRMSVSNAENPGSYERVQFMKHFSGIE